MAEGEANPAWALPEQGVYERDDVFEVFHLLHDGAVVDLISFQDADFNREISSSARAVGELGPVDSSVRSYS